MASAVAPENDSFTKKISNHDMWFNYNGDNWNILMKNNEKTYEIDTDFSPYLKTCYFKQVHYLMNNFESKIEHVGNKFMLCIDFILGDTVIVYALENKPERLEAENYALKSELEEIKAGNLALQTRYRTFDRLIKVDPAFDKITFTFLNYRSDHGFTPPNECRGTIFNRMSLHIDSNVIFDKYIDENLIRVKPYSDGDYIVFRNYLTGGSLYAIRNKIDDCYMNLIHHIIERIRFYDNLHVKSIKILTTYRGGSTVKEKHTYEFELSTKEKLWDEFKWDIVIDSINERERTRARTFKTVN